MEARAVVYLTALCLPGGLSLLSYVMALFASSNFLCCEVYFTKCQYSDSCFLLLLLFAWYIFFYSFKFNLPMLLYLK